VELKKNPVRMQQLQNKGGAFPNFPVKQNAFEKLIELTKTC